MTRPGPGRGPLRLEVLAIEYRGPDSRLVKVRHRSMRGLVEAECMWAKSLIRNPWHCIVCGVDLARDDEAFRPLDAVPYVRSRACTSCFDVPEKQE